MPLARWVPLLVNQWFPGAAALDNLALAAGAGAVLGHVYTCWLKFKGGKGIAITSAGVGFAWAPEACAVTLAIWIVVFAATRYVSVASIVAAVVLPLSVWFFQYGPKMTIVEVTRPWNSGYLQAQGQHPAAGGRNVEKLRRRRQKKRIMKVTVIGAGAWGTALAHLLCQNGNNVTLWGHNPTHLAAVRQAGPQ